MLDQFKSYIKNKNLFHADDKILLAVSGGIDSIVMMHLFYESGFNFGVVHCNFKLRSNESDEDEKFVRQLAKKFRVQCYTKKFRAAAYARKYNLSIQMAARKLRYHFFEETRKKHAYHFISTGHNANDSAETVVLNLIRGTGISGMHGILSKNGTIIRPLLFASRKEISSYAKKKKILWREDSSNISVDYLRNKLRHKVMPEFLEMNPSFLEAIQLHSRASRETELLFNEYIKILRKDLLFIKGGITHIDINALKSHEGMFTLLFELLKEFDFNRDVVQDIYKVLDSESGKIFLSPTHRLVKDRKYLMITSRSSLNNNDYILTPDDHYIKWEDGTLNIRKIALTNDMREKIITGGFQDKNLAFMDIEKIKYPLHMRKWKKGDVFHPLGMNGKMKLSDYFVNNKHSVIQKEKAWLLVSGNHIAWIIGQRTDSHFKVTRNSHTCIEFVFEKR